MHNIERLSLQDRIAGTTYGTAGGDALGVPPECMSSTEIDAEFGYIREYRDPSRNKFFLGAKIGTYSDDTQLTLALMNSLTKAGGFDPVEIARGKIAAMNETTQGWGGSTKESVMRMAEGVDPLEAGRTDKPNRGTGNGVAMHIAPLALYAKLANLTKEEIIDCSIKLAIMTHRTSLAISSGLAQVAAVLYCLDHTATDFDRASFIEQIMEFSSYGPKYLPDDQTANLNQRLGQLEEVIDLSSEEISQRFGAGSCYVFDSLPFTYAFFLKDPSSLETLYQVINAGGDTDTNGAICGALLGALNGAGVFSEEIKVGLDKLGDVQGAVEGFLDYEKLN